MNTNLSVDNMNADVLKVKELFAEKTNIKTEVDDKIDETSENPVLNKVIAEALKKAGKVDTVNGIEPDDNKNVQLPIDSELSSDSENPVLNSTISKAVERLDQKNSEQDEYALRNRRSILDIQDALDYLGVFVIREAADLIRLQDKWNNKEVGSKAFALQVADIDMSEYKDWVGIGSSDNPFAGQFNGNFYKITGLSFNVPAPVQEGATKIKNENNYIGLINQAKDAVIKNVDITIDGFKFDDNVSFDTSYNTLSKLKESMPTGEENVIYRLDLNDETNGKKMYYVWDPFANSYVSFEFGGAGILGKAVGSVSIDNVKVHGEIGSAEYPCAHNCAGIVISRPSTSDHGNLTITNSENNANIYSAYTKAGGILAFQEDPTAVVTIENCLNTGNVKGYVGHVSDEGGIAGILGCNSIMSNPLLIMHNVRNTGRIESSFHTGDYLYHSVAQIVPKGGGTTSAYTDIYGVHKIDEKLNAPLFAAITANIHKIAYLADNELKLVEGMSIAYDGKTVTSSIDLSLLTKELTFDYYDRDNPVYLDILYGTMLKPRNISPSLYDLESEQISPILIKYWIVPKQYAE